MVGEITSPQNRRVKDAVKLRGRRQRTKQKRIIIDGTREIRRAMDAKVELLEVFCCQSVMQVEQHELLNELMSRSVEVLGVTAAVFEKLAFGDRNDGLVAIATTPSRRLEDLPVDSNGLVVVVESLEKPGNVGAVLRSADAAGIDAVIVAQPVTDLHNPNTIRSSLGAVFTVPTCEASNEEVLRWLRAKQLRILTARVDADSDYRNANLLGGVALVLGAEATGLSAAWEADDIHAISLPMKGQVDSLNISVTAGVLMYEAQRRRDEDAT
ncbi:MAG: TrmH family RNA methyltransferase [Pirellulaceae bacterium]|jgi:TrmH family RNA methyltransferase